MPQEIVVSQLPSILKLLEQARLGDAGAIDALFAQEREPLRRAVALRLDCRLAARFDASDVVQQTLLEAARRLPTYLEEGQISFPLWLRGLARDKLIQLHRRHIRAEKRAAIRELAPLPADSSAAFVRGMLGREAAPSQAAMAAELADGLRTAIGRLDDDERDLILWRHFEQLSNQDVAAILGINAAAASKRYVRALERLRVTLLSLGIADAG